MGGASSMARPAHLMVTSGRDPIEGLFFGTLLDGWINAMTGWLRPTLGGLRTGLLLLVLACAHMLNF